MSLVLARIDERLIHGQVVVGWVPALSIRRIVVADDTLADDPWEREMVISAAPPGVTVQVVSPAEALTCLEQSPSLPSMLLVRAPVILLGVVQQGLVIAEANLGGMYAKPGSRRLSDYLNFTPEDIESLQDLVRRHVRIVAQDLPGRTARDLTESLAEGRLAFDQLPARDP